MRRWGINVHLRSVGFEGNGYWAGDWGQIIERAAEIVAEIVLRLITFWLYLHVIGSTLRLSGDINFIRSIKLAIKLRTSRNASPGRTISKQKV
jgi:hypothetical protein